MRRVSCVVAIVLHGLVGLACRQVAPAPPEPAQEIVGIEIGKEAYLAYQQADCETVYRLTGPGQLDAMQATELRYSLRLVRGFCQELDGDQPAARVTYREVIDEARTSFAAADARERLRILDQLADDPAFAKRLEDARLRVRKPATPREPSVRTPALYPPLARASGVEGFAVVEYGVARDGRTLDPVVVASEPPLLFDGTAVRAVQGWEYRSKRKGDPDERHVIRFVFQAQVEPTTVEEAGSSAPPTEPAAR